jgi:Flp pilus assembly protein TadG
VDDVSGKISNEKGSVAVIVALCMTVLMGFSAIVVDYGRLMLEKQNLQNAVDAACLAGAQELPGATAVAQSSAQTYFSSNGFSTADINSIQFENANKRIRMTASKTVEYTFAKILTNQGQGTVHVTAAAEISSIFGPYDYALFSGSQIDLLQFTGQNAVVGDVHSNDSIKNKADINGNVTAVGTISADIKASGSGDRIEGYSILDMPDHTKLTQNATVLSAATLSYFGATYNIKNGIYEYALDIGQLNSILHDYPLAYIDGNVTIATVPGQYSEIAMAGGLIATGNIVYDGSNVGMASQKSLVLCSTGGNIVFHGGNADLCGILYAPNGSVSLDGTGGKIYGSVIADIIDSNGGMNVVYDSTADDFMPETEIRLVD